MQLQFARFAILAAIIGPLLPLQGVAGPSGPSHDSRAPRFSIFSGFDVWGIDDGRTVKKLGLQLRALYILRDQPVGLSTIPFGNARGVSRAEVAPTGDVFAYGVFGVEDRDSGQVAVADTSGRVIAVFPRAQRFRWNSDGSLLALGYAHEDVRTGYENIGERRAEGDSIVVWHRAERRSRGYRLRPMTIEWGVGDTLYLGYPGRVDALDVKSNSVTPTRHRWAAVSPDREYSLLRDEVRAGSFGCIEEATDMQVSGCLLQEIGFAVGSTDTYMSDPCWIRSPVPGHLLCVSACEGYWGTPGQTQCRSAILDPRTLEALQSFPGRVVAQTHDGRSLAVLRGDSLAFLDIGQWSPRPRGAAVRVKVEVQPWGGELYYPHPPSHPKLTWYYGVAEGDWLPSHTNDGACDKAFQVTAVLSRDSIVVSVPPIFTDRRPTAIITRAPITLRTASMDGGYDISLCLVP